MEGADVARKRRAATRGYVECLGSAARHECDWRFYTQVGYALGVCGGLQEATLANTRDTPRAARGVAGSGQQTEPRTRGQNRTEQSTGALSRRGWPRHEQHGPPVQAAGATRPGQGEGGRDVACGWGQGSSRGCDQPGYAYILSQAPPDSQATSHPSKRGHTRGRPE